MTKRAIHLLLVLSLVASAFAALTISSAAQDDNENNDELLAEWLFFPWVPHGSVIDDPREGIESTGPYYGSVTIQNLEDEEVELYYAAAADADMSDLTTFETTTLAALASVTITSEELFGNGENALDGGGVLATAQFPEPENLNGVENEEPPRITGVQKQAAPVALGVDARTSSLHDTVGGYTGVSADGLGNDMVLPIVQTNSNWNSLVRITNFDHETTADVHVTFRQAGGGWTSTVTVEDVEPGQTATVDLLAAAPPGEWVGSAVISSEAQVGVVAERVKNETNMLIMNVAKPALDLSDEQYAPLVFHEWFHWNTGISLVNLTSEPNTVTITYYDVDGTQVDDDELTLPAEGMDFIYTPFIPDEHENGADDGFRGSAVIESDGAIYGAVDEVKYTGELPDVGHAMSYMIEERVATLEQSLVMPLVQMGTVEEFDIPHGDTSGIQLFNPTESWIVFSISFIEADGTVHDTVVDFLLGNHGRTFHGPAIPLPDDFQGSAIIQVESGAGAVVAASNIVNYDVGYDGSSSYNLVQADGLLLDIDPDDIPEEP